MKQCFAVLAAAVLTCACLTGCGADRYNNLSESELVEQIVTYHGSYGDAADEKVDALLDALRRRNDRRGALWTNIMDYWDYANEELAVNTDSLPDDLPDDNSLAIIVLGYALNSDGTMQDELLQRLAVGMKCAEQYPNAYVICTGGGTALNRPDVTEGGLMGQWMLENGLDKKRLIIEDESRTTAQNAINTYQILQRRYPDVHSAAIVSSSYHIACGALMFEAEFQYAAAELHTQEIHVVSDCACPMENLSYPPERLLQWETAGMLEIIRNYDLAVQYYRSDPNLTKPAM